MDQVDEPSSGKEQQSDASSLTDEKSGPLLYGAAAVVEMFFGAYVLTTCESFFLCVESNNDFVLRNDVAVCIPQAWQRLGE